jgi:hypothetical protein
MQKRHVRRSKYGRKFVAGRGVLSKEEIKIIINALEDEIYEFETWTDSKKKEKELLKKLKALI